MRIHEVGLASDSLRRSASVRLFCRRSLRSLLVVTIVASAMRPCWGQAPKCGPEPSDIRKAYLIDYVRKIYTIPASVAITLPKIDFVEKTCYRELTFRVNAAFTAKDLSFFLSPDGRFLTSELLDTEVDPVELEKQKNQALFAGSLDRKVPSLGPINAEVRIVEFSDFQCPFCRRFSDIVDRVLPSERERVRIVFHHFPLAMHSWARLAAQGAACAQVQDGAAFWPLSRKLFAQQESLTAANIKEKLLEYATAEPTLDREAFKSCLDDGSSLGLVLRDMNLGEAYNVVATPTIFINNQKVIGVKSVAELQELIDKAQRAKPATRFHLLAEHRDNEIR